MNGTAPTETGFAAWLKLQHAPGLGLTGAHDLLARFGSATEICKAGREQLRASGIRTETIDYLLADAGSDTIDAGLTWAQQPGHYLITLDDARYPPLLKSIDNPPLLLYVQGNPALLSEPQLAIVGSRNPTPGGRETAYSFAGYLARAGLVITSGLALGIDGAAHEGVLQAKGATLAVMATGADQIYPGRHRKLAEQIRESGALVTEMPLGTPPLPALFPQRNRIISGLTLGTLVVEAALRSGSLITARLAMEQAREVFAIPGSIHNPLARGCHRLIRQGAKLVESVQDILEELAPQLSAALEDDSPPAVGKTGDIPGELDADYRNLLENMSYDPVSIDQLVSRSGLSAQEIASMLLILELNGHICARPGGLYQRLQ
jgi:DNA processing protein